MSKREEQQAARDFVMARLAACRGAVAIAGDALDQTLALFIEPDEDKKGKARGELLETIDDALGEGARAVQAAQELFDEIDTREGEPDIPEGDGEDPEDDDDDDDEEETD